MKVKFFVAFLFLCVILISAITIGTGSSAQAQNAKKQLDSFGYKTGKIPDVPPPTRVNTSTGTAGGYSVGGSTTTTQGTAPAPKPKTGSESAH